MATLMPCMDIYPIFDNILSYLSATDAACVLGVTGKLYLWDKQTISRYINIYKDLSKYTSWVERMISNHHTILLVGADVKKILYSHKYPLTYWKSHDRREERTVWLFPLAMAMCKNGYGPSRVFGINQTLPAVDESGQIHQVPDYLPHYTDFHSPQCRNGLCSPKPLSMSITLPPPTRWPSCTASIMWKDSWLSLSTDNYSKISMVFFKSYCRQEKLFSEAYEYLPRILGCSKENDFSSIDISRLPYIDLKDGSLRSAEVDTFQSFGINMDQAVNLQWGSLSNYNAFTIEFYRSSLLQSAMCRAGMIPGDRFNVVSLQFSGLDPHR